MNEQALKLFKENYSNEGLCHNLDKFVKSFDKEFKKSNTTKTISYLPWAVVERIFRMQGGKIEVAEWVNQVEFDFLDMQADENGVFSFQNKKEHALFIHLKATWQGEVEDEFYPLFDNQNAKIIKSPDALDLNTAKQRGMVRLIARVSGIGLWIFEQQDTQFGDDLPAETGEKTTIKVVEKITETKEIEKQEVVEEEPKKRTRKQRDKEVQTSAMAEIVTPLVLENEDKNEEVPAQRVSPETVDIEVIKEEPKPGFLKKFLTGESIEPKKEQPKVEASEVQLDDFAPDTEEYAQLLLDVRGKIRTDNLQPKAKEFVKTKNKELLSQLTYSELQELKKTL